MWRLSHVLVVLLAFSLAGAALGGAPRTETQGYDLTHYLAYACPLEEEFWPEPQWGNCFDVQEGETAASIVVTDATGHLVEFIYTVYDAEGNTLVYDAEACGSVDAVLPAGAAELGVWPSSGAFGGACDAHALPSTTGTIAVTFS